MIEDHHCTLTILIGEGPLFSLAGDSRECKSLNFIKLRGIYHIQIEVEQCVLIVRDKMHETSPSVRWVNVTATESMNGYR